jgi:hypothetical protein
MPGIFAQALLLGATQTGVGLAEDLSTGMIDRLRSLPMARSAVLAGRTLSDKARNTFVLLLRCDPRHRSPPCRIVGQDPSEDVRCST